MIETWRWFGPTDKVTLSDIRQTGASGIVTSLYHLEPFFQVGRNRWIKKSPDQLIMASS
jgi:D-mannonate dehydratase